MLDDGGNGENLEAGIEVSAHPFSAVGGEIINIQSILQPNSLAFEDLIKIRRDGKKYLPVRMPKCRVSMGLRNPLRTNPINRVTCGQMQHRWMISGWWESPWFGTFYRSESGGAPP